MTIYTIQLPTLYPLQKYIANYNARFKVVVCGRRWGKTRMCINIAFSKAIKGKKVWWVAPTYAQSMIAWRLIMMIILQLPKELGILINIAEKTITFPNNGLISFKSADHPENLRGEGLDFLIMDEADFCKELVWTEVLRPALADRKGEAIFISTPYKENGWFHKLYLSGYPGNPKKSQRYNNVIYPYYNEPTSLDKDVVSFQLSTYTNPYIDHAEIEKARLSSTELVFQREFLAYFISSTGARIRKPWIKYITNVPEKIDISIGVDLAISQKTTADYTAICVLGRDKINQDLYILDMHRGRYTFYEQKQKIIEYANKWIEYDPLLKIGIEDVQYQKAIVQELSRITKFPIFGIHPITDKVGRFASIEAKYQHGQIFHIQGLPLEFESELLSFPLGDHDDMVDSIWNAYQCFDDIDDNFEIVSPISLGNDGYFKR